MLDLKLITTENLEFAINLENEIFPEYNAKNNYISSIKNSNQSQFFLIFDKELCVGITGIYSYKDDRENAWLGFFGIKEEYRDRGYGKKSLKLTEDYAKSLGFKYMRLFTDRTNEKAIKFYQNNGYTFEDYNCEEEEARDEFDVVIGSKALGKGKVEPWNNEYINITKQTYKQQYTEEVIEINDNTSTLVDTEEEMEYKEIKLSHKTKKRWKIINKMLSEQDIKYRGILSYRYLRIIAWVALAISQYCLILALGLSLFNKSIPYPSWIFNALSILGNLSIPFFLLATFSIILSRNRTYKSLVLFYGIAYLGLALVIIFIYDRYIGKVIYELSGEPEISKKVVLLVYKLKTDYNVFGDLFVLTLFNFFLNYELNSKYGKKTVIAFRSLCVVPLLFALVAYILTVLGRYEFITMPFEVYPFLPTKSPLVYLVFICMSLWIKNRERIYVKLGATKKEYNAFLRTNKNSLAFSIHVCVLFLVASIIDAFVVVLFKDAPIYNFGQTNGLILAIPFILLFSYNKTHQEREYDLLVPFIGIILLIFAYIEAIYEVLIAVFH